MEWLFGRKKSEARVEVAKDTTLMVDDFVMCPPIHEVSPPAGYPSLPNYYPHSGAGVAAQPHSIAAQPHSIAAQPHSIAAQPHSIAALPPGYNVPRTDRHKQVSPLDSIPFKLSSKLSSDGASATLPADIQRIGSYLSQIRRSLDSSELDYDFKLEQCVLRETAAFNGL